MLKNSNWLSEISQTHKPPTPTSTTRESNWSTLHSSSESQARETLLRNPSSSLPHSNPSWSKSWITTSLRTRTARKTEVLIMLPDLLTVAVKIEILMSLWQWITLHLAWPKRFLRFLSTLCHNHSATTSATGSSHLEGRNKFQRPWQNLYSHRLTHTRDLAQRTTGELGLQVHLWLPPTWTHPPQAPYRLEHQAALACTGQPPSLVAPGDTVTPWTQEALERREDPPDQLLVRDEQTRLLI